MHTNLSFLILLVLLGACDTQTARPVPPEPAPEKTAPEIRAEDWITPAEKSGFTRTPTYEETLEYLHRMEEAAPWMQVSVFGRSAQGRDMVAVVASRDGAFTPEAARKTALPVVMIQSGIHSGEIGGKDATLMILRDILTGDLRWILDEAILLLVPIYNVDGHERISKYNRPNQDGPEEGMGFRTTAAGLDLNRDSLKVVTPEARALTRLFTRWRPHMHVDNHVTNGSDHAWTFMWSWPEVPQQAAPVDRWMSEHMDDVVDAVEEKGYPSGPYVWLKDGLDPSQGFYTTLRAPRFVSSYVALHNRPSILVETHSYKPFETRVRANREFLVELIRAVGEHAKQLMEAEEEADAQVTALGAPDAGASDVVLTWEVVEPPDRYTWPVYAHHLETSVVTGEPILLYERGEESPVEVPWYHRVKPGKTVSRPRGYLVLPGWPQIDERLAVHGLEVQVLTQPVEMEVETIRLSDPVYASSSYQGCIRVESIQVQRTLEVRSFPAGTLWIPASQPGFQVAVQLLEPEAPDSLVSWGMMNMVTEPKTWIGDRTLEHIVSEMVHDPEVASRWEEALEDPSFAKDAGERKLWWYRRTPHWDHSLGLMPVMRVMTTPDLATEPWEG